MKSQAMSAVFLASIATIAPGQDYPSVDLSGTLPAELDRKAVPLPRALSSEFDPPIEEEATFSIGPAAGYLHARGADRGTWFGGAQARLHFAGILAAEASITFHQNRYEHGDVVVTQYPVQLTAFFYPIPEGPVRPYILGGVGWYYTSIEYKGVFSLVSDKTEHIFGEHLGAGVELMVGPKASIDADVRYIFLNPSNDQVIHREFNYWQVTLGLNLFF